jgi:transcriptional regulator with XRE-family HTH domain
MKNLRERCAAMLRLALRRRRWTRTKLAEKLDVSPQYVTALLSGRENLTLDQLERVATVLRYRLSIWIQIRGL